MCQSSPGDQDRGCSSDIDRGCIYCLGPYRGRLAPEGVEVLPGEDYTPVGRQGVWSQGVTRREGLEVGWL